MNNEFNYNRDLFNLLATIFGKINKSSTWLINDNL